MAARADYWRDRDGDLHRACFDAARMIRSLLEGEHVDGRKWGGLHVRLLRLEGGCSAWNNHTGIREALVRARLTLEALRRGETS